MIFRKSILSTETRFSCVKGCAKSSAWFGDPVLQVYRSTAVSGSNRNWPTEGTAESPNLAPFFELPRTRTLQEPLCSFYFWEVAFLTHN